MRLSVELGARQAAALRLIAEKERRSLVQYLRDALHFLVQDRAALDADVRRALGYEPEVPGDGKAAP